MITINGSFEVDLEKGIVKKRVGTKAAFNPFAGDATMAKKDDAESQDEAEHEPSPYKYEWRKYIGKYRCVLNGYEMKLYAQIGIALGYPAYIVKVYKRDGNLYMRYEKSEEVLDEYLPGLFFTPSGGSASST